MKCPQCGSTNVKVILDSPGLPLVYECRECGEVFDETG